MNLPFIYNIINIIKNKNNTYIEIMFYNINLFILLILIYLLMFK